MKKLVIGALSLFMLILIVSPVFAGAKNSPYYAEWFWKNPDTGNDGSKSAYFQPSKSGLINGWTYEHPDLGDARFVIKPLSKFKNAQECDEGWVRQNASWTPRGIFNSALETDDEDAIKMAFGEDNLDATHLFCAYPMD